MLSVAGPLLESMTLKFTFLLGVVLTAGGAMLRRNRGGGDGTSDDENASIEAIRMELEKMRASTMEFPGNLAQFGTALSELSSSAERIAKKRQIILDRHGVGFYASLMTVLAEAERSIHRAQSAIVDGFEGEARRAGSEIAPAIEEALSLLRGVREP